MFLKNTKYKIIILGEREIISCKEYTIHQTFSIYNDLISNLNNYEDLTIQDNTINNELESLLKTFNIFNKSKLNIYIGNGGVSELISFVSNNILGLTGKTDLLNINNYLYDNISNIHIYNNYNDFLNYLKQMC